MECLSCGHQRDLLGEPDACPSCGYLGWAAANDMNEALRSRLRGRPVASRRFVTERGR